MNTIDLNNKIAEILCEFKQYLEEMTPQMVMDIVETQELRTFVFLEAKSRSDVAAVFMEYDYDILDICAYAVDKNMELVTKSAFLPTKTKTGEKYMLPKSIREKEAGWEDEYDEDDDYLYEIMDKYNSEKIEIFTNWFYKCWEQAKTQTKATIQGYFSVHDTFWYLDLNTMKKINENEIKIKLTTK